MLVKWSHFSWKLKCCQKKINWAAHVHWNSGIWADYCSECTKQFFPGPFSFFLFSSCFDYVLQFFTGVFLFDVCSPSCFSLIFCLSWHGQVPGPSSTNVRRSWRSLLWKTSTLIDSGSSCAGKQQSAKLLDRRHGDLRLWMIVELLRGAWSDRDTNDIFAHCSLIFYYLDFKFSNFVRPSELHPLIWFFLKNSFRKKKIIQKTTQNALAPSIFILL